MDPGFRRESALVAVSSRAGRPPVGGELAMTAVILVIAEARRAEAISEGERPD